jgi:pimeloyl-ACP methyl ester carboxylesterase
LRGVVDWRDVVVDCGGMPLAVRDYGGSGEPPLLLLHGSGDTLATWDELAPLLTPLFRVVAHDAPGHGQSEDPGDALRLSHFLAAVEDVAAALRLERPILVGHSLGGGVALLHAAERGRVRAVVSVDGAYAREPSDPPYAYPGEEEIRTAGFGRSVTAAELEHMCALATGPAQANLRRAHRLRRDGRFERRPSTEFILALSRLAVNLDSELTTDELYSSIRCPTLLICGEHGWVQGEPLTLELRRRVNAIPPRFPHVDVVWLDCGHMIHWEQPHELAAVITAFAQQEWEAESF